MILIVIFNVIITNFYNNLVYGRAYYNSVIFVAVIDEHGYFTTESEELLRQIALTENIEIPTITQKVNRFSDYNEIMLKTKDDYYYWHITSLSNDATFNRSLSFSISMGSNAVLTQSDFALFSFHHPKRQLLVYGSDISGNGEVLISDFVLNQFGIKNHESMIGKKISFMADGEYIFKDLMVVGVIDAKYFMMHHFLVDSQIIVSASVDEFSSYDLDYAFVYAPIDSFENSQKVFDSLNELGLVNSFIFNELAALEYSYIVKIQIIIRYVLSIIGVCIVTAILLNIYSVLVTQMKNKMVYHGMMRAMGMGKASLHILCSSELMIILLSSTFLSAGVSAFLIRLFNYYTILFFSGNISVSVLQYLIAIVGVFIGVCVVTLFMSNILLYYAQRHSISEVLRFNCEM
jgi:hypothetical protein